MRYRLLVLLCLLAAMPGPAMAGDAPAGEALVIDALLGFAGTFRPGRWTPLTVSVANRGDAVTGTLEVVTHDGDEFRRAMYPVIHQRALALGRDARRRFHFTVYLESLSRPLEIRVVSGGRTVARRSLDLRRRFSPAQQLLVVSRDADLDYLNREGNDGLRVLYPHPDQLPRQWQGYDAVAAMILHGLSLESLDALQFDALLRWIARGGVLAVSGGPDYALLDTPRLATLLPATPVGLVAVTDAQGTGAALGAPLEAPGRFHLNRVARIRGEVLDEADGLPLVLESRRGDGRVLYLTFDVARYPFDRWTAMADVWTRLLDVTGDAQPAVRGPDARSIVPGLLGSAAGGFPGHGTLLLFLALYLCVLATAYRIRAATSPTPALGLLAAAAVPALFAPAAFALFGHLLFQPGTHVTLMSVIEPLPRSRFAALRVDLGVHSTRADRLTLEYAGASPVFRVPLEARRGVGAAGWLGGPGSLTPVEGRAFVLHQLQGDDTIPFDLAANITDDDTLVVRNDSGHAIEDAWLVLRGDAWYLGTVKADARLQIDLTVPADRSASDRDEWWSALARGPQVHPRRLRATVEVLQRKADGRPDHVYPGPGHALLLGYTGTPLRLHGASAGWSTTALSLVLLRFPARAPSAPPRDETNETT